MGINWESLRTPFHPSDVDFRPGATTKDKTKAIGLAYVDKRLYEDRLDEVIGTDNWSVEYRPLGERGIICRLSVYDNESNRTITREDVGEFATDDVASFPTAVAQAFKRACSAFGLGRYLYSLPQVWAEYDAERRRFTPNGLQQLRQTLASAQHSSSAPTASNAPTASQVQEVNRERLIARIEELLLEATANDIDVNIDSGWRNKSVNELMAIGKKLKESLS
jgi:hypothetical protein